MGLWLGFEMKKSKIAKTQNCKYEALYTKYGSTYGKWMVGEINTKAGTDNTIEFLIEDKEEK